MNETESLNYLKAITRQMRLARIEELKAGINYWLRELEKERATPTRWGRQYEIERRIARMRDQLSTEEKTEQRAAERDGW